MPEPNDANHLVPDDGDTLVVAPDPAEILGRFNLLVDELEAAEQRAAVAAEALDAAKGELKSRQGECAQVQLALRSLAREMRRGPAELPLFGVQ